MKGIITYLKPRIRLLIFIPVLLSWVVQSCGGVHGETRVKTNDVLRDLAFFVILDTYQQLEQRGQNLQSAIEALAENITPENVTAARQAWRATRQPWESSEGFLIGPVETDGIDPSIDSWPVDTTGIQAVLASNNDLTPEFVSFLDGTLKGYHTIEYILFTNGGDSASAEAVAGYLNSNPKAVQFLHSLIVDFNEQVSSLVFSWTPGEGGYADELANAGQGSAVYPTLKAGLTEVVNGILGIAEEVGNEKLNVPFSEQNPVFVESRFSSNSITDFINNITSIEKIYFGLNGGLALDDIVEDINAPVNDDVQNAINEAIDAIHEIPEPYNESLLDPALAPVIQNAVDKVGALLIVLQEEVFPIMFPGGDRPPVDET